jgi:hypothetical protein
MLQQRVLLLSAVALLLMAAAPSTIAQDQPNDTLATTAAATPAANNSVVLNSTAPAADAAATATPSVNGSDNGTTITVSTVDQPIPPFSGIRSCLPFNILLAAAQVGLCDGWPWRSIAELLLHARQYSSCCACMSCMGRRMCAVFLQDGSCRKVPQSSMCCTELSQLWPTPACMVIHPVVCCRSVSPQPWTH